jgi:hypothetical protein
MPKGVRLTEAERTAREVSAGLDKLVKLAKAGEESQAKLAAVKEHLNGDEPAPS